MPFRTSSVLSATGGRAEVWQVLAICLGATLIATFFALVVRDSTFVDGEYLPRANDSFYHARRILDAATGEREFYQFDERLHAPDGSWIPWPWAYDYAMAKAAQIATALVPGLDPAAFIAHVPVAWLLVNAALFLLAARALGLRTELLLLALLCFALSPLTQLLHSIGMVDHHYVEHTFVLLAIWLGLRWFEILSSVRRAALLGSVLGVAPAFHNGLFLLQLLPLGALFLLWLKGTTPPTAAVRSFALGLLVTTQFVLLPSEPYWEGFFEFGLLSWFHLYVAAGTVAAVAFLKRHAYSPGSVIGLGCLAVLLTVPIAPQLFGAAGFLSGSFSILDRVVEVHSPYRLFTVTFGPLQTAGHYSWLLLLAPPLLAWFALRATREREPTRAYYAVCVVFGLTLLLAQFRFHYFGFFALVTAPLLLAQEWCARKAWHRGVAFTILLGIVAIAYQPALRERLFTVYAPGADPAYAEVLPAFRDLKRLCADDPGIVLADSNDGSPILFHSDCSVIANNFILRNADAVHLDEIDRLMRLSPAAIREQRPDIRYLLVRASGFIVTQEGKEYLVRDIPIAKELFLDAEPPAGFSLLRTITTRQSSGAEGIYARLYRLEPSSTTVLR